MELTTIFSFCASTELHFECCQLFQARCLIWHLRYLKSYRDVLNVYSSNFGDAGISEVPDTF